jgi:tetratricopeptide (TPR) repeat protein
VDAIKKYRPDEEVRSYARMHVGLGKTYVAAANDGAAGNTLEKARDSFNKAINIFPLLMSAYNDLILVYKKLGQYEEASKVMTLAMEIAPSTPEDWVSLFEIFLRDGDEKKARVCLDKAIKFDPENQIILCLAAEAYVRQGLIPDAITLFEKAAAANPSDPRLYNFLGVCARQLNRHQLAIGYYLKAVKLDPDDAALHFNLGNAYWNVNDPASAKQEFETALRLNPGFEEARVELGKFSGTKSIPTK